MWIPTPFYERIPQFMLLVGVIFISSAVYLGFAYPMSQFYFGVGVACCFWGLVVFALRRHYRTHKDQDTSDSTDEVEPL